MFEDLRRPQIAATAPDDFPPRFPEDLRGQEDEAVARDMLGRSQMNGGTPEGN